MATEHGWHDEIAWVPVVDLPWIDEDRYRKPNETEERAS